MSDDEQQQQQPSRVKSSMRSKETAASAADGGATGESQMILENSPGEAFVVFIEMANLANKLKLLNYEDEYLLRWKMRPISRFDSIAIAFNRNRNQQNLTL
jgi:hypothetical protein